MDRKLAREFTKWAAEIKAYGEGRDIQVSLPSSPDDWSDYESGANPRFFGDRLYRVKPEPAKPREYYIIDGGYVCSDAAGRAYVCAYLDPRDSAKLKVREVLDDDTQ